MLLFKGGVLIYAEHCMYISCLLDVLICNYFKVFSCLVLNRHLVIVFKMYMVYVNPLR